MKYKGIIFDLDGVIVSTDEYHYQAWKELADNMGIEFNREINDRLRGVSRMESLEIILEKYNGILSQTEKEALAEQKNKTYIKLLNNMSHNDLDAGVLKTLNELREYGYKLAIGSSSKNAKTILYKIGLSGFFDAVSDGNNIEKSKPDPEVFLKAAGYINLAPGECVIIEDAVSGIDAAINGGFASVAIGSARNHPKAGYKIESLSELADLFK